MPVPFQEFLALASSAIDKASGARPFIEIADIVLPTLDVTGQVKRWQFNQQGFALTVGQTISFVIDPPPPEESHIYHFIGFFLPESGAKICTLALRPPSLGIQQRFMLSALDLSQASNFIGRHLQADPEQVDILIPLVVPSGFTMHLGMDTGVVAAGPLAFTLMLMREVVRPSFDTTAIPDDEVTTTIT